MNVAKSSENINAASTEAPNSEASASSSLTVLSVQNSVDEEPTTSSGIIPTVNTVEASADEITVLDETLITETSSDTKEAAKTEEAPVVVKPKKRPKVDKILAPKVGVGYQGKRIYSWRKKERIFYKPTKTEKKLLAGESSIPRWIYHNTLHQHEKVKEQKIIAPQLTKKVMLTHEEVAELNKTEEQKAKEKLIAKEYVEELAAIALTRNIDLQGGMAFNEAMMLATAEGMLIEQAKTPLAPQTEKEATAVSTDNPETTDTSTEIESEIIQTNPAEDQDQSEAQTPLTPSEQPSFLQFIMPSVFGKSKTKQQTSDEGAQAASGIENDEQAIEAKNLGAITKALIENQAKEVTKGLSEKVKEFHHKNVDALLNISPQSRLFDDGLDIYSPDYLHEDEKPKRSALGFISHATGIKLKEDVYHPQRKYHLRPDSVEEELIQASLTRIAREKPRLIAALDAAKNQAEKDKADKSTATTSAAAVDISASSDPNAEINAIYQSVWKAEIQKVTTQFRESSIEEVNASKIKAKFSQEVKTEDEEIFIYANSLQAAKASSELSQSTQVDIRVITELGLKTKLDNLISSGTEAEFAVALILSEQNKLAEKELDELKNTYALAGRKLTSREFANSLSEKLKRAQEKAEKEVEQNRAAQAASSAATNKAAALIKTESQCVVKEKDEGYEAAFDTIHFEGSVDISFAGKKRKKTTEALKQNTSLQHPDLVDDIVRGVLGPAKIRAFDLTTGAHKILVLPRRKLVDLYRPGPQDLHLVKEYCARHSVTADGLCIVKVADATAEQPEELALTEREFLNTKGLKSKYIGHRHRDPVPNDERDPKIKGEQFYEKVISMPEFYARRKKSEAGANYTLNGISCVTGEKVDIELNTSTPLTVFSAADSFLLMVEDYIRQNKGANEDIVLLSATSANTGLPELLILTLAELYCYGFRYRVRNLAQMPEFNGVDINAPALTLDLKPKQITLNSGKHYNAIAMMPNNTSKQLLEYCNYRNISLNQLVYLDLVNPASSEMTPAKPDAQSASSDLSMQKPRINLPEQVITDPAATSEELTPASEKTTETEPAINPNWLIINTDWLYSHGIMYHYPPTPSTEPKEGSH